MNASTAFVVFIACIISVIIIVRMRHNTNSGDVAITAAVNAAIAKEFSFANIQIDVKTINGVVILGGFTREFQQAKRAEEIARAISGVNAVESRIAIRSGG